MRVARLAARAEGYRRHAQGDRDVGVGGGAGELGVLAEYPVRGDRRLHQGVGARRDARWAIAQELDLDAERRGGGGAAAVLVVRRARQRRAHRDVELRQRLGVFTAQVQVEPGLLGDRVQAGPAAQADDGAGGAWGTGRGDIREQGSGPPYRVRPVGDADRGRGETPSTADREVV